MELHTPHLLLREFQTDDFDALHEILSDPVVRRYEGLPFTVEQTREHLEHSLHSIHQNPRIRYRLAVTLPPQPTVRGYLHLSRTNASTREWEIGWFIHPQLWGQGYATEAARALQEYGFRQLGVHRLVAFCNAENKASERIMQKLGLHREALLHEALWQHERWHDELVYALLEKEYPGI